MTMNNQYNGLDLSEIILTILLLDQESMGRYQLADYLQTSKARTRKILNFLVDQNLAISKKGRGGTKLNSFGQELANNLANYILIDLNSKSHVIEDGLLPEHDHYIVCFVNATDIETNGLTERDMTVREGADGAITIIRYKSKWVFPGEEKIEVENFEADVDYNLAIICFAKEEGIAIRGAIKAGLYHIGHRVDELIREYLIEKSY